MATDGRFVRVLAFRGVAQGCWWATLPWLYAYHLDLSAHEIGLLLAVALGMQALCEAPTAAVARNRSSIPLLLAIGQAELALHAALVAGLWWFADDADDVAVRPVFLGLAAAAQALVGHANALLSGSHEAAINTPTMSADSTPLEQARTVHNEAFVKSASLQMLTGAVVVAIAVLAGGEVTALAMTALAGAFVHGGLAHELRSHRSPGTPSAASLFADTLPSLRARAGDPLSRYMTRVLDYLRERGEVTKFFVHASLLETTGRVFRVFWLPFVFLTVGRPQDVGSLFSYWAGAWVLGEAAAVVVGRTWGVPTEPPRGLRAPATLLAAAFVLMVLGCTSLPAPANILGCCAALATARASEALARARDSTLTVRASFNDPATIFSMRALTSAAVGVPAFLGFGLLICASPVAALATLVSVTVVIVWATWRHPIDPRGFPAQVGQGDGPQWVRGTSAAVTLRAPAAPIWKIILAVAAAMIGVIASLVVAQQQETNATGSRVAIGVVAAVVILLAGLGWRRERGPGAQTLYYAVVAAIAVPAVARCMPGAGIDALAGPHVDVYYGFEPTAAQSAEDASPTIGGAADGTTVTGKAHVVGVPENTVVCCGGPNVVPTGDHRCPSEGLRTTLPIAVPAGDHAVRLFYVDQRLPSLHCAFLPSPGSIDWGLPGPEIGVRARDTRSGMLRPRIDSLLVLLGVFGLLASAVIVSLGRVRDFVTNTVRELPLLHALRTLTMDGAEQDRELVPWRAFEEHVPQARTSATASSTGREPPSSPGTDITLTAVPVPDARLAEPGGAAALRVHLRRLGGRRLILGAALLDPQLRDARYAWTVEIGRRREAKPLGLPPGAQSLVLALWDRLVRQDASGEWISASAEATCRAAPAQRWRVRPWRAERGIPFPENARARPAAAEDRCWMVAGTWERRSPPDERGILGFALVEIDSREAQFVPPLERVTVESVAWAALTQTRVCLERQLVDELVHLGANTAGTVHETLRDSIPMAYGKGPDTGNVAVASLLRLVAYEGALLRRFEHGAARTLRVCMEDFARTYSDQSDLSIQLTLEGRGADSLVSAREWISLSRILVECYANARRHGSAEPNGGPRTLDVFVSGKSRVVEFRIRNAYSPRARSRPVASSHFGIRHLTQRVTNDLRGEWISHGIEEQGDRTQWVVRFRVPVHRPPKEAS